MIILYILLGIAGFITVLTVFEIIVLILQKPIRELPDEKDTDYYSSLPDGKKFEDLYLYLAGEKANPAFSEDEIFEMLLRQCRYMEKLAGEEIVPKTEGRAAKNSASEPAAAAKPKRKTAAKKSTRKTAARSKAE